MSAQVIRYTKSAVSQGIGFTAGLLLLLSALHGSLLGAHLEASGDDMNMREIEAFLMDRIDGFSAAQAKRLATHLLVQCEKYHFSVSSILSVIAAESDFDPAAVSSVGAIGLMQLMPDTADYLADKMDIVSYHGANDLYQPEVNVTIGIAYLAMLRDRFTKSSNYLAAYNLGPAKYNRMAQSQAVPYDVGEYVRKVQNGVYKIRQDAIELSVLRVTQKESQ